MKLAFDKSARTVDADGRLHIARSHITKAIVNPYYGREIPGWQDLGLSADQVYKLLRDPAELEAAAETFARLPILSKHVPVTVDAPQPDLVIGAIGSNIEWSPPYVDADLVFWDANAIAGIETKEWHELSCAYRYVPVMEPGEYEGEQYDGRMTQIRGNHLALVDVGRAGPDVVVADANPFVNKNEVPVMKMTKLGKALIVALGAMSPALAADSAMSALVGGADKKSFDAKTIKTKLLALDSEMDPQQLDNVIDTLLDVEESPTPYEQPRVATDSPEDQIKALLEGKVDQSVIDQICELVAPKAAVDEDQVDEKVEAAMDSFRKQLLEANTAAREVRDVVGDVAMDSAAEIYAFALDQMGVKCPEVEGAAALRALFKMASAKSAPAPVIAVDSGIKQFPAIARFKRG